VLDIQRICRCDLLRILVGGVLKTFN